MAKLCKVGIVNADPNIPRPLPAGEIVQDHKRWSPALRWLASMARESANWFLFIGAGGKLLGILARHTTACAGELSAWADENIEQTKKAAHVARASEPLKVVE